MNIDYTRRPLTPPFPMSVNPVHVGVYKLQKAPRNTESMDAYAHWSGMFWGCAYVTPEAAVPATTRWPDNQDSSAYDRKAYIGWQGLLENPNAPLFQMPDSGDPARRQDSGGYYG